MQILADKISELLTSFPTSTGTYDNFSLLLRQLKDGLLDPIGTKSNVVALKDYQQQHTVPLNSNQTVLLNFVYDHLTDKSVVAAE